MAGTGSRNPTSAAATEALEEVEIASWAPSTHAAVLGDEAEETVLAAEQKAGDTLLCNDDRYEKPIRGGGNKGEVRRGGRERERDEGMRYKAGPPGELVQQSRFEESVWTGHRGVWRR